MVRALGLRVARRALASAAAPGGPSPSPNPLRYGGPILPALPIGFVSGAVGSAVGIGGALVAVPTTMHAYRLRQLQATSTALLLNVATCASGALVFASAGHVDPIAGCLVASGATATAGPGARLAHAMRERTQRLVFASALLALAPVIALKPVIGGAVEGAVEEAERSNGGPDVARGWRPAMPPVEKVAYYVGLGGAVGVASGALGIGAGTMMSVGLALAGGHATQDDAGHVHGGADRAGSRGRVGARSAREPAPGSRPGVGGGRHDGFVRRERRGGGRAGGGAEGGVRGVRGGTGDARDAGGAEDAQGLARFWT